MDGTRRDPSTCATPAPARPLIQIREEAEGHANRMRTDCIDGRIFVHLLSHRTATDTFRKARHQIKKSCNAAHDFICLHTSANFGPFFSFPFLHPPPPTLPLISFLECASIEDPWWGATEVIFICLITVGLHFPPSNELWWLRPYSSCSQTLREAKVLKHIFDLGLLNTGKKVSSFLPFIHTSK